MMSQNSHWNGQLVAPRGPPGLPVAQEPRPGVLRLADEDRVRAVAEVVLGDADPRPADHHEASAPLELRHQLEHAMALHAHPGDADDVGVLAAGEIDLLDVLVDQGDAMFRRGERGEQRQRADRQVGALAEKPQARLQPPEGYLEARIDDDDVGHRGSNGAVTVRAAREALPSVRSERDAG
jgi:hypothetical protein